MKAQKSTSVYEKYSYAKKYYNTGKYSGCRTLEEVVPYLQGTPMVSRHSFCKPLPLYKLKDYAPAQRVYQQYYTNYPSGEHTEEARFYSGYGLAQDVPDPRLDQS